MEQVRLAISFKVRDEQKETVRKLLDEFNDLIFLKDIEEKERGEILSSTDILIAWNPVRELKNIEHKYLQNIKFVQLLSAGYDHLDFDQFPADCVIASNAGAYAGPMAEHIVGMILTLYKYFLPKHQKMAQREFDQLSENRSLKGAVCGIIGFGGIGKAAAELLRPFGTQIYAVNTSGSTNEDVAFCGTLQDLNYILHKLDIIVVSLPLTPETRNLIGKHELELMKPNGMIVNVARGAIINQQDLYNHLKNNPDFLAGIDAWWSEPFADGKFDLEYPFFELPNFLGSPHNSAVVPGSLFDGVKHAINNVLSYVNREKLFGVIPDRK